MLKKWIHQQNVYLWASAIGIFGLLDAITPGPRDTRIVGGVIVLVCAYMWILQ